MDIVLVTILVIVLVALAIWGIRYFPFPTIVKQVLTGAVILLAVWYIGARADLW